MVSPVYSVIIIIVGVLMLVGVAGLFLVCGLLAWQTWALVKVNRVVGEALAALVEPMKQAGTKIDAVGVVVTELVVVDVDEAVVVEVVATTEVEDFGCCAL